MGILRGRSFEIVGTLEGRSVDICCLQETRYGGKGMIRINSRKVAQYKLFSTENEKALERV